MLREGPHVLFRAHFLLLVLMRAAGDGTLQLILSSAHLVIILTPLHQRLALVDTLRVLRRRNRIELLVVTRLRRA